MSLKVGRNNKIVTIVDFLFKVKLDIHVYLSVVFVRSLKFYFYFKHCRGWYTNKIFLTNNLR